MASIEPHILKDRIPRELQFPVRYADLESCIVGLNARDAYLDVHFLGKRAIWKGERERRIVEGRYRLLEFSYLSEQQIFGAPSVYPWSGQHDAIVVSAWVYPVPRSIGVEFPSLRAETRGHLHSALHRLMPQGMPCDPWRVSVELSTHSAEIVVGTQAWRGIRDLPEASKAFPIDRKHGSLPIDVSSV